MTAPTSLSHLVPEARQRPVPQALLDALAARFGSQFSTAMVVREQHGRDESSFDHQLIFDACAVYGTAVEINCRPERQDPPPELLDMALDAGCFISIDTDLHSPGHLEFLNYGADRAAEHGIDPDRIINTWSADDLLTWTRTRRAA